MNSETVEKLSRIYSATLILKVETQIMSFAYSKHIICVDSTIFWYAIYFIFDLSIANTRMSKHLITSHILRARSFFNYSSVQIFLINNSPYTNYTIWKIFALKDVQNYVSMPEKSVISLNVLIFKLIATLTL